MTKPEDQERLLETDAYVFLDVQNPWVAWGAYRGVLVTRPVTPLGFVSAWLADLLRKRGSEHVKTECDLERIRAERFPERISRLGGFFCFHDLECAQAAARLWNTATRNNFSLEYLAKLSLTDAEGRDQLDSNWITYAQSHSLSPHEWMMRYWQGNEYPKEDPIWETMVEGRVIILGTELRERAYQVVKSHWPKSLMLLEISRLAALIGSDLGSIHAYLDELETEYLVDYRMNVQDAENAEFLSNLSNLMQSDHPKNWADLDPWIESGSFGHTPDLTPFSFRLAKGLYSL